jgi:hypothetical protein
LPFLSKGELTMLGLVLALLGVVAVLVVLAWLMKAGAKREDETGYGAKKQSKTGRPWWVWGGN